MKRITLSLVAALIVLSTSAEARHYRHHHRTYSVANGTMLPHPDGCPRVAFCGCGASVRLFGRPVRELYLAANWFKFPRATPAPGHAAVRSHHVFILEHQLPNGNWMVYDANSGGHGTRLHERSLAGYVIVAPHA